MMQRTELVSILKASFEAGFLVDETGNVLFGNKAAQELFGLHQGSPTNLGIDNQVVFLHNNSPVPWNGTQQVSTETVSVICTRGDGTRFSSIARLALLGTWSLVYIRHDEGEETMSLASSMADHALEQEQNLVASILDAALDPLFQINEKGIIKMVNKAATTQFGWTREEFIGSNISMIVGGEHATSHDQYLERYFRTGEARVMGTKRKLPARRQDGSEFIIQLSLVEVDVADGEERMFCGFILDLTEQILHAALLEQKANHITAVFDAALDPLLQINEKGIIRMVNKAATTQFGWTREEFIGSNISMIVGKEHASRHDQYLERYLRTGEARVMGTKRELTARRKDGSEFIIQLSLVEVDDADGEERMFCGFILDLTEQKQQAARLIRERSLIKSVIDAALDPLLQINDKGIIVMANTAATTQFGWTREEFIGSNISIIVGAEHAARHDQYLERYLRTGEARVMGTKRELSARRKDGSEFIIQLSLVEVDVADGGERMFCGFIVDLTEQKRHLAEIQRRESFTNKIIEGSYDALLVTDKDGKINRVNAAAVGLFGASNNELYNFNILSLLIADGARWLKDEMEAYLSSGISISAQKECGAVRPDGEMLPVLIGASEVEGPDGESFFAIYLHDLTERKKMLQIEAEKNAAEYLLFNMLPEEIAGQLKNDPSHIAQSHSFAAVLFADIVGFTAMSSMMDPCAVVSMLNDLFSMFDEVVENYGLNKVKTIGDCYMVTSVPAIMIDDEAEHCRVMCHFGLDMIATLHKYNSEGRDRKLDLRVGINCGPVVAGVVGTKRFLYDLWGDAVNLASRMESTGIPGRIQTTGHVAELAKDDFNFERRGMVHIKGKGDMETHFLTDRKKPYTPVPMAHIRRMSRMSIRSPAAGRPSLFNSNRDVDLVKSLRVLATELENTRSNESEGDLVSVKIGRRK